MTVEEPWARVVSEEADSSTVIRGRANRYNVALGRVHVVVRRVSGRANDREGVTVKVDGVSCDDRLL